MNVKILFNGSSLQDGLSVGWGVSFLIDNRILFDTGEKGYLLANNIKKLEINLSDIENIVISHDHWDHTGGLWDILKKKSNVRVYGCAGFSDEFKSKVKSGKGQLIEVNDFTKISKDVYITGEIKGEYKNKDISEQAMILDTKMGLTVITGCAHPGILEILYKVKKKFSDKQFYCAFGGFHLMNKQPRNIDSLVTEFQKIGITKVGPTHCSGTEAENIFRETYKNNFLTMKVGESFTV